MGLAEDRLSEDLAPALLAAGFTDARHMVHRLVHIAAADEIDEIPASLATTNIREDSEEATSARALIIERLTDAFADISPLRRVAEVLDEMATIPSWPGRLPNSPMPSMHYDNSATGPADVQIDYWLRYADWWTDGDKHANRTSLLDAAIRGDKFLGRRGWGGYLREMLSCRETPAFYDWRRREHQMRSRAVLSEAHEIARLHEEVAILKMAIGATVAHSNIELVSRNGQTVIASLERCLVSLTSLSAAGMTEIAVPALQTPLSTSSFEELADAIHAQALRAEQGRSLQDAPAAPTP